MATTTTTTTTTSGPAFSFAVDRSYLYTLLGKIHLVTLGINVICFISYVCQSVNVGSAAGWFCFVCSSGFWISIIELFLILCGVQGRIKVVPWKLGYLVFHGLWCFFYLTAASAVTHWAQYYHLDGWYACTFFGFVACIIYGINTYLRGLEWRAERTVITTGPGQPA